MKDLARIGVKLPAFRLATMGGRSVALADLLGRPSLFYLWASWDPSRETLGLVERVHREHGKDLQVAGIAFDVQGPAHPMRYLRAAGATFPCLIDACCLLSRVWGVRSVPLTILADATGHAALLGGAMDAAMLDAVRGRLPVAPLGAEPEPRVLGSPSRAEVLIQGAVNWLSRRRVDDAVQSLKDALELDPQNDLVRRQVWALKYPDRFYKGPIDEEWLKRTQASTRRHESTKVSLKGKEGP